MTDENTKERVPRDRDFFLHDSDEDAGVSWREFRNALQIWSWMRPGDKQATVREAADMFGVTDEVIRQAVNEHYWMCLGGPEGDATQEYIDHDGD